MPKRRVNRAVKKSQAAFILINLAINKLHYSQPLDSTDRMLIFVGLIAPIWAIGIRFYYSEKRFDILLKLLRKDGILKS